MQCEPFGCSISTESPSPGTPAGLQLRESVHEWLSAAAFCELPTHVYVVPPAACAGPADQASTSATAVASAIG